MPNPVTTCSPCGATAPAFLICKLCGKEMCRECVLDAELRAGCCWMCLDWTMEGRMLKGNPARQGRFERRPVPEPAAAPRVVALYCDGGVVGRNPSPVGGTWAWCGVDATGRRVVERGGFVPATAARLVTNNHTEQIAVTLALEAMPPGWSGVVYSDSMIALGRVFLGWARANLPANISRRSEAAVRRAGYVDCVLLKGHPSKATLRAGFHEKQEPGKDITCVYPVSEHNVWCDEECGRQARAHAPATHAPAAAERVA